MKAVFKKAIFCTAAILFLILNTITFSALSKENIKTLLPLATASQSTDENEGNGDFNFIKSNENVKDFLYDGSLLLYGGIALISISVLGIVVTFMPRRHKKRRTKRSNSNRPTRK